MNKLYNMVVAWIQAACLIGISILKIIKDIFSDRLTISAAVAFSVIVALVVFVSISMTPEHHPLFGSIIFLLIPIIFIIGALIFFYAILRS